MNHLIMKELTLEQMETTQGGKFWGWGEWSDNGQCNNGIKVQHQHYYILWFEVATELRTIAC